MEIKPGDTCYLVFKVQAFTPVPNEAARTVDAVLNILTGIYRGEIADTKDAFVFETEASSGTGIVWAVKREDVLMMGIRCDTPRLARV